MATGVNVKMGVSGVQQFKQGMKESQAAVKTLDQALKLNEQQLKSTGDAELYLQNKTKILEDQIRKQAEVVRQSQAALDSMRRNGVQETSTAFQQMQANVYKASTDLMRMRTELENVDTAGEDASTGVDDLNTSLKDIGKGVSWQNVTSGIGKITDALEAAAKKAWQVGVNITKEVLGAGNWADDLHTRAQHYGLTDAELQRMDKTAKLIDTSVDSIVNAQKKLRLGLGKEDEGVMGAFAALLGEGYDPRQTGWEDAFWDAGEALMKFTDAEEKEVYAQKLFGRSWNELIPLFETGREEYDKLNESWSVVSDENLKSLQENNDQFQKLNGEWETFKMTIMATLSETLTPVMETLTGLMKEFNDYLATPEGKAMLEALGQAVAGLFTDLTQIDPEKAVESLTSVFNKLKEALEWVFDNKQNVIDALKAIVAGWGALKLTGGALEVMKLVNGLKQLNGGSVPNQMDATDPGRPGGTYGMQSGNGLAGLVEKIAQGAGVSFLYREDERLRKFFQENLGGLTAQEQQEKALLHDLGLTQEQANHLGDEHLNEDPLSWTGRGHSFGEEESTYDASWMPAVSPFAENLQTYYAEPADRMTEVAGEMTQTVAEGNQANADMTAAAESLTALPESLRTAVENAVKSGMSQVTIVINEGAVDLMGRRMGAGFGKNVVAMIQ